MTDAAGVVLSQQQYKAWGETRYTSGSEVTRYQYTGQYSDSYINLLDYGSRRYDPELGRFTSPDSIVPLASQGVQAWDRYAYVNNAPTRYTDPTGHCVLCIVVGAGLIIYGIGSIVEISHVEAATPIGNNASNIWELMKLGVDHADHVNITGEGLQSLKDDPSVQGAQERIIDDIKENPNYGKQAFSIPGAYTDKNPSFTASGPSKNWVLAGLTGNPAFWMMHRGRLSATNTHVSADGTISTTWEAKDQFDYLPDLRNKGGRSPLSYLAYNVIALGNAPVYYGMLHAKSKVSTTAHWNQTIPPPNSCRNCPK